MNHLAPNCPAPAVPMMPTTMPRWMDPTPDRPWRACSHCGSTHPLDWAAMTCFPGTRVHWTLDDQGVPCAFLVTGVPNLAVPGLPLASEHQPTLRAGLNTMHLLDIAPKPPAPGQPVVDTFSPVAQQIHATTGWVIALAGALGTPTLEFSREVKVTREPEPLIPRPGPAS